jgi:hypothetical protein
MTGVRVAYPFAESLNGLGNRLDPPPGKRGSALESERNRHAATRCRALGEGAS